MKISVLIAAYHAGRFLPAALSSLAQQTHGDWELVVVEDGSHDETAALVEAFAREHLDRRVHYDNLGQNRGVAAARNRLLALANGEAMAFLDADDLWRPTHLADLASALRAGAAIAFSGIELWDSDQQKSAGVYLPPSTAIAHPRVGLYRQSFIHTSSCVGLSCAAVTQAGSFDETLRIGEDRDFWFRALAGGATLRCTGQVTCVYTKHGSSSMTQTLRVSADNVAFYRKHLHAEDVPASVRRAGLADALMNQGRLLRASEPRVAQRLFREALRCEPLRLDRWPWVLATIFSSAPASVPATKP
jgi:glycosyltransferase involved in cell wall biosynthesis